MYVVTIFPYVMLTVLLVRGCTLEGASLGIEFYLKPDFDRLTDGTASDSLYFLQSSSLLIISSDSIRELCQNSILYFSLDSTEAINSLEHPADRALTSDWFVNSFAMVICEKKNLVVVWTENFLIHNNYQAIYRPVRSECSSCRLSKIRLEVTK